MLYNLRSGVHGIMWPKQYFADEGVAGLFRYKFPELEILKKDFNLITAPLLSTLFLLSVASLGIPLTHPSPADVKLPVIVRDLPESNVKQAVGSMVASGNNQSARAGHTSSNAAASASPTKLSRTPPQPTSATNDQNLTNAPLIGGSGGGPMPAPTTNSTTPIDVIVPPSTSTTSQQSTIVTPEPTTNSISAGGSFAGQTAQVGVDVFTSTVTVNTSLTNSGL